MSDELFEEGGPLNVKRTSQDNYEMRVSIPVDEDGMVGRECPREDCSPGYFKVKTGTGITENQEIAFCPYCQTEAEPGDFITQAQKDYAIALVRNNAIDGVNRMLKKSLGLGSTGKRKIGGGLFSIEMSLKPGRPDYVPRPIEEELRRDIVCPNCGLVHSVFGLATWCADCGQDIFLVHVDKEFQVVEKMLSVVDRRRDELGARVAGRDIENAIEDTVSIFEAVMKIITKRHLSKQSVQSDEIADILEKHIRNQYQNVKSAQEVFKKYVGIDLFDDLSSVSLEALTVIFEKRHPITHNLGVVDRKYLARARSGELQGREIRVSSQEVFDVIEIARSVISSAYKRANVQ
jgi:hypothetical protein